MQRVYSVCIALCGAGEVPRVAGSGGGWGSRLSAPICCSWPQGQRARQRETIRLLAAHAARGGWLNTTAGVTNRTSLADIIESSPALLPPPPIIIFLYLTHPAPFQLLQLCSDAFIFIFIMRLVTSVCSSSSPGFSLLQLKLTMTAAELKDTIHLFIPIYYCIILLILSYITLS